MRRVSSCATLTSCVGTPDEVRTTAIYGAGPVPPVSVSSGSGDGVLTSTSTMTYNGLGQVLTLDGPLAGGGDLTVNRYDAAGQRYAVVGPDPDLSGGMLNRAQRITYNARGQVTLVEAGTTPGYSDGDWANFATLQRQQTEYDSYGRPLVARQQDAAGNTLALQQLGYDAAGRTECSTTRMNPGAFSNLPGSTGACLMTGPAAFGPDRITQVIYDAASRPISTISGVGSGSPIAESVTYTANGQPQTLTDSNGNVSILVYDGFDRTSRLRYPNPSGGGTSTTDYEEYTYDAGSNVTAFRNRANQTIIAGYDALNRQTSLGGAAAARTMTYDNLNRLLKAELAGSGLSSTNEWDALSRLKSQAQSPLGTVSYGYDAAGRRTYISWPDGYYAAYQWNYGNDLITIKENGAPNWNLAWFGYDNLGRVTVRGDANGVNSHWGYDGIGRLSTLSHDLAGSGSDLTLGFTYNPASQIVTRSVSNNAYVYTPTGGSTTYVNNGLNQVTSVNGGAVVYDSGAYPANGNITTAVGANYDFNAINQLIAANPGWGTSILAYDPLGRLYQTTGGATYRLLYDGVQAIGEYDGSGNMTRRFVPGLRLDDYVLAYEGSGVSDRRYMMADERGSVVAYTDGSTGGLLSINTYDEYGVPGAGNAGRFQYTGQMWLPDAGVYHYRARAYAPQIGRFLQTDPVGYEAGLNLYSYVGNDPINFTDPLGLLQQATNPGDVTVTGSRCSDGWLCFDPGLFNFIFGNRDGPATNPGDIDVVGRRRERPSENPLAPGDHHYERFYPICEECTQQRAFQCLRSFSAPGAPYAEEGVHNRTLAGGNPIRQTVSSANMTILNETRPGHVFGGSVRLSIASRNGVVGVNVVGGGYGPNAGANQALGPPIFQALAFGAYTACGGQGYTGP